MIVFKSTQRTMQSVGLLFTSTESALYKIYRWISFAILSTLLGPLCVHLMQNYNDLIEATEICIYISAETVMMVKAIFMFYNQTLIKNLLQDLQTMANQKISIGREKLIFKFDREAERICKLFVGMLAIAVCIWSGGPVVAIIYRQIQGTYVPHEYGLPFKGVWPFDSETTPGYEIAYVVNVIFNIYLATYFAACDLFFVSCGMHFIGATQDLELFLLEIDDEIDDMISQAGKIYVCSVDVAGDANHIRGHTHFRLNLQHKLRDKLGEAIKSHCEIIRVSDNLAEIEHGIIFSQFLGVLFSLSAIAFQVVISEGEKQLFFLGPSMVIICQLFLYCYYGQRITDQALRLSESIYQLKWYNYPLKYQKCFQVMILRSQNASSFSGFGFVDCSLERFTDVLKFVGSVVALFQSLQ